MSINIKNVFYECKLTQEGALTSFTLYDPGRS